MIVRGLSKTVVNAIAIFSLTLLLFISLANFTEAQPPNPTDNPNPPLPSSGPPLPAIPKYTPRDNILIACGAPEDVVLSDGRTFKSDPSTATFLNTDEDVKANVNAIPSNNSNDTNNNNNNTGLMGVPLFLSANFP
uniref:Receptor protein serine/threonine kinase n=1 Tax=Opuntia streptacantha TaxID=393608 RepID=A0A7C8YW15_OPUST